MWLNFLWLGFVIAIYMIIMYFVAIKKVDFSIVDVAYGIGFILLSFAALLFSGRFSFTQFIPIILVTLWGARLAWHIYKRNKKKGIEDIRYQNMRENWQPHPNRNAFFKVFLFQGMVIYIITFPIMYYITFEPEGSLHWFSYVGLVIWLVGYYFEVVGDAQLKKFIANPENKGHIIKTGLWRYTRHPNYFGEATMWWGLFFFTLPVNFPLSLITIISPLWITILLLFISGVPLLEKHYEGNMEYEEYKKHTSKFFPLPPKK